jgi:thiol-disulfide isomerase/thioredoxin
MPEGAPPEPPLAELDQITFQHALLHGRLASTGDNQPRWLPVGGVTPSLPSKTLLSEIRRAVPADAALPTVPALFYTSAGDVLPGTLHGLDESGVEIESSLVELKKLSADNLNAIQFNAGGRITVQGFGDAGWHVLKGDGKTVIREDDTLKMEPETAIGHLSAMQCNEISFTLDSTSAVRLRLFCAGDDPAQSSNLVLWNMGSQVYYGMESSDGQLASQSSARVLSGHLAVRLVILEKQVELFLNDVQTQKFPVAPVKRAGAGLIIEPASLFGNSVNSLALSKFSATSEPGCTLVPNVSDETKTQALTVPRFRKDDPPRHALLAANGDVLRGEIEAVTASHFAFRSGLESLTVPLERVKAAIWLKKAAVTATPPVTKSSVLKELDQTIEQRMGYGNASLSTLLGGLQREAPELKFKFPPQKRGDSRFPMQFGGQTVGEALNQICSLFGMHYQLGEDDTIILEAGADLQTELVQKVYWLKADAFPTTPDVKEILAGKGVAFPPGAGVGWNPDTRQLSMTNSEENHGKLVEVLATDFGGSLGSPTHWLLLTSGARLGLAVEKFERDFISGTHPVYGRCKVPISDVYVIRTSMPEPNVAMKSLGDWRLVSAPEQVLPEAGGESSPTLGTDAKSFKLPLLDGGEFELAHEKGKIIVLDFWATWCGPCIRSLPGLIEAVAALPSERVKLIGVNQGEPKEQVKRFLGTRGWKIAVAMDMGQSVGRLYGVDGIPHTVVIGADGKIAWVKTGYSPDGEKEVTDAVTRLLAIPSTPAEP